MAVYSTQDTGEIFPGFCRKCQFWKYKSNECDTCQIAKDKEPPIMYTNYLYSSSSQQEQNLLGMSGNNVWC